jgi:UDP-3-O-[3-hydroxymyristoyl] glucosamine N-acyltransferase
MKISELAERIGARLESGASSADGEVSEVTSFAQARAQSVVFVEQQRFLEAAVISDAGAVILPEVLTVAVDAAGKALLRSPNPRLAFARAADELRLAQPHAPGVHPSAVVDPSAELDPTASIGELVVIGAGVKIGPRTRIGPGSVLAAGVVIGADCDLVARVTVYSGTTLGERVIVQAGAVLGGDGFGFVPDPATGKYHKFPQIGRLEIGDDVEIGANTTIDRGALEATIVGNGVKLDNLIQVGHNVRIGHNVVVAAQSGISGSTVIEDGVIIGGQVGIADHVVIGSGVILGSQAGVPTKKVIRGKGLFWGTPARPIGEYLRELAILSRLAKKEKE